MRFQILIFLSISIFASLLTGCPGAPPAANNTAATPAANTAKENSNSEFATTAKTPEPAVNDAPTLKPVFKAYCEAKTKNDEAGLRKVYSQATLKQFEADMKAENIKTLVEYLEVDQVSTKLCEISNEKIDGDSASALIKTEGMPKGNVRVKFVKENGEWKYTNQTEDAVRKTDQSSNAAK